MTQSSSYALRLPKSLKEAVVEVAKRDGISINQFIALAVAEKLSALETARFFEERRQRADMDAFFKILNRAGGEAPRKGDEMQTE
ncbi:MAG: toxin-antitoxin system HicB family antitoxin [Caldilineaceae bacterium]